MNNSRTHLNNEFIANEQNEEYKEIGILKRFKNCIKKRCIKDKKSIEKIYYIFFIY